MTNRAVAIRICTFLLVVLAASEVRAQDRRYTNEFLAIGINARGAALGGAYSAANPDGSSFFWNPASIGFLSERSVTGMYSEQFGFDIFHHYIGYAHPIAKNHVVSVAWVRHSVNNIKEFAPLDDDETESFRSVQDRDFFNDKYLKGTFNNPSDALFISYARMNNFSLSLGWGFQRMPIEIPIGVNLKLIRTATDGIDGAYDGSTVDRDVRAVGIGADLGLMIRFGLNDLFAAKQLGKFTFALNIQDITKTAITWDAADPGAVEARDVTPVNARIGLGYDQDIEIIHSRILTVYDYDSKYNGDHYFGFEYGYNRAAFVRFGYGFQQFTYGAGLAYRKLFVDFAMKHHELGNTPVFSVRFDF